MTFLPMNFSRYNSKDRWGWNCPHRNCTSSKSVRDSSWFNNMRIPIQKTLIYVWSIHSPVCNARKITGVTEKCIIQIYQYLRDIASWKLMQSDMKLGGPGIIIQIDESLFRHKPIYHRGHRPASEKWDFGMADTSKKPARISKGLVQRRNAETLIPIIERVAAPGSTIWSDQWRAYCRLEKNPSYIYAVVNHSQNLVDPGTGVHTQSSESY